MRQVAILAIAAIFLLASISSAYSIPQPNAKVRAFHMNGEQVTDSNPAFVNEELRCIGGIDEFSDANDFHCYVVDPDTPPPDYKTDNVYNADTTTIITCPSEGGFNPNDICFEVIIPASVFDKPGDWHFVGEFTKDGNIIDIAGVDYRVHSFMVLPEAALGSIAIVGSIFASMLIYRRMKV